MTQHKTKVSIAQMRDHALEARDMATGYTRKDLDENRMLALALTRLLETIGEAASRVPMEFKLQHPAIQWREIVDLRNRLIHGYDIINPRQALDDFADRHSSINYCAGNH